jgi:hypothetical protein
MNLQEYFARPDTPAENSPAGKLIQRILKEGSATTPAEAQELAMIQLLKAASKKNYRPLSPKQDRERAEKMRQRFSRTPETGKSAPSTERP